MMMRVLTLLALVCLGLLAASCAQPQSSASCTPGTNIACTCMSGPGTQSCTADRVYGACICNTEFDGGGLDLPMADLSGVDVPNDVPLTDVVVVDAASLRDLVLDSIPPLDIAYVRIASSTALPNYSCRRAWDQALPDTGTINGIFNFDFGGPIGTNVDIKFYPNNDVAYDLICTGGCFTRQTNTTGSTSMFTLDTGRFTAWASPQWTLAGESSPVVPAMGYFVYSDVFLPYDFRLELPRRADMQANYERNGMDADSPRTTLTGAVHDCDGRAVHGAVVRVFDTGGLRDPGDENPRIVYGALNVADVGTGESTNDDGRYVGFHMDPDDNRGSVMRVEAWANIGLGRPELVACERVRFFGDMLTDVPLRPIRTAAPPDCTPDP